MTTTDTDTDGGSRPIRWILTILTVLTLAGAAATALADAGVLPGPAVTYLIAATITGSFAVGLFVAAGRRPVTVPAGDGDFDYVHPDVGAAVADVIYTFRSLDATQIELLDYLYDRYATVEGADDVEDRTEWAGRIVYEELVKAGLIDPDNPADPRRITYYIPEMADTASCAPNVILALYARDHNLIPGGLYDLLMRPYVNAQVAPVPPRSEDVVSPDGVLAPLLPENIPPAVNAPVHYPTPIDAKDKERALHRTIDGADQTKLRSRD